MDTVVDYEYLMEMQDEELLLLLEANLEWEEEEAA